MADDKHIDRYIRIKKAALDPVGQPIECFVVAAVDTSSCYWGADYGDSVHAAKAMLSKLAYMSRELRQHIKRLEEKG